MAHVLLFWFFLGRVSLMSRSNPLLSECPSSLDSRAIECLSSLDPRAYRTVCTLCQLDPSFVYSSSPVHLHLPNVFAPSLSTFYPMFNPSPIFICLSFFSLLLLLLLLLSLPLVELLFHHAFSFPCRAPPASPIHSPDSSRNRPLPFLLPTSPPVLPTLPTSPHCYCCL